MYLALCVFGFVAGWLISTFSARITKVLNSDCIDFLTRKSYKSKVELVDHKTERDVERRASSDAPTSQMLTRSQVEHLFPHETWQRQAYDDFAEKLLAKDTFPCVYASKGFKSKDHRYIFLLSDDPSAPDNVRLIGDALATYLQSCEEFGPNTSLVLICPRSTEQLEVVDYNHRFWNMLRGLRIYDTEPWPTTIPQETMHSEWTFCYGGVPLFPVIMTPAHEKRRSRHASSFVIAIQPRSVLDRLLATPEKRESAVRKVRALLENYDEISISPDLSTYGAPGTTESRQLCLLDDNITSECPYDDLDK